MGAELGRISGPLLAENLLRRGADLSFETQLLYLDVNTGKVGINTDAPSRDLTINGTTRLGNGLNPFSDLIVDTQLDIADLIFVDSYIQNAGIGTIIIQPNQATDPTIVVNELQTSKLKLSNSAITTLNVNDDIELSSNGIGRVVFNTTRVDVNGNLHATGNITFNGDITFGNNSSDNVEFLADINSNLNPNFNHTYNLGSPAQHWRTLYTGEVKTETLETPSVVVNSIDMLLTQGNILYVSVNGDDTFTGTSLHNTFKTLKHALSVAQAGDEIVIFPGTYVEDFPLTVPQGVSVNGTSLRATTIKPSVLTQDKDAFLMNGDTTVTNLCIQDAFYNAVDDTGYGFRFAPGFKTISRSPYIQNISILNKGSVTTTEDPLGFNAGDAGRGALADGSVADPSSKEASMLFHSVTFIVPGADGITATNGVRIEWLNSFTYFANRGIYLTTGTLGRASLGVKYGAELRSIGSANVYGTYGAVADGSDTLGYLIGHNFGYVGTGGNSQNDEKLTVQANEVVPINDGILYYDSMDQKGDYRVGDVFFVDQSTGKVVFNAQSINFTASGNITFDGPTGQIILDATKVQVSNLRIHDNNIDSLAGPVNFHAFSGTTTLNTTVNVTSNVTTTGDVLVKGDVFLGNTKYDLVTINPKLTQNINPRLTNTYTLGLKTPVPEIWNTGFLTTLDVDGVTQFTNNTISTLTSNTDLRFVAAGTGKIKVTSTDVLANNDLTTNGVLTVNGSSSLKNTVIGNGAFTTNGVQNVAGADGATGLFFLNGWPSHPSAGLQYVRPGWTVVGQPTWIVTVVGNGISDETITITGGVFVSGQAYAFTGTIQSTVTLTGNINQTGDTYITGLFDNHNIDITGTHSYYTGPNIEIYDNIITTTVPDSNLTFVGSGTAGVVIDNKLKIVNNVLSNVWSGATTNAQKSIIFTPNGTGNVVIDSATYLQVPYDNDSTKVLSSSGELRQNSTTGAYEGYLSTGNESFTNVYSSDKRTYILPELTIGNNDNVLHFVSNAVQRATIDSSKLTTPVVSVGDFTFSGNTIHTNTAGADLVIQPDGLGSINLNNILFKDDYITNITDSALTLVSTGTGYVKFGGTAAVVFPFGDNSERRVNPETGESRYNTQLNYMEVWNGTSWIPATGTSGAASLNEVIDIFDFYSLILG